MCDVPKKGAYVLSGSLDGSFIHVAEESVLEARRVKKWDGDLCWF